MGAPVLLAAALPHVLVAEAVVGARPHGGRARAAHGHRRARHAPLLPRVVRDARPARRSLPAEAHPARDPDHRGAAPRRRPEPLGARSRPLLPHPQGRAAGERARAVRRVDLGDRRDQSPSRADTPKVQWSSATGCSRSTRSPTGTRSGSGPTSASTRSPPTHCTTPGTVRSAAIPCTRPTSPEDEERAGRWAGSDKLECGIHEGTTLERTA